jgi:integrase
MDVLTSVLSMASLWKHPNSQFWTACWTDRTGRRMKRSTKTAHKGQALRLAHEFEESAGKHRTAKQVRKVIEDIHKSITGEELPTITLRAYVVQWLTGKEHGTKDSTQTFYKGATTKFITYLGDEADVDIVSITKQHLDRFRAHQAGVAKLAPKTVNHDIKCLKMLFKAAKRDGYLIEDISEHVDTVRETKGGSSRNTFTLDQLRAIIEQASPEWKSMILVALYTGQRLGDVALMQWSQIDLTREEIRLTTAKTGKSLVIPMARPLADHLLSLASSDDPKAYLHPKAAESVNRTGKTGTLSNQFVSMLADAQGLRISGA